MSWTKFGCMQELSLLERASTLLGGNSPIWRGGLEGVAPLILLKLSFQSWHIILTRLDRLPEQWQVFSVLTRAENTTI